MADAHVHLEWLAQRRLGVGLEGASSLDVALRRIRAHAAASAPDAWVIGRGWVNDDWPDRAFPDRAALDEAAGGRPALMTRKDGHSAWLSSAALRAAGMSRETPDPPGGVIDRDRDGVPTGIVRETAVEAARRAVPPPSQAEFDQALRSALAELTTVGLTSVHTMDTRRGLAALQRLHERGRLPIRVTYNLPAADLAHAEALGLRSGWGSRYLRIWGVKAFLDGSLGSRTAEMLDGSGVPVLGQAELVDLVGRCARGDLNVALHAIGDGAVRRALDALEPFANCRPSWRPRIEHAQCVHPQDLPRFARAGVIASMQPVHAVADRQLADREWPGRTRDAYAWRSLLRAGARLAFGSDAPVETADPLAGIAAATTWRRQAGWHPELAISRPAAIRAYTSGPAFAAGMEREVGSLRPGMLCDLTLVKEGRAIATVVGGKLLSRRD